MFGLGDKKSDNTDKLTVQVHVVVGEDVFKMAQKIWDENARSLRLDEHTRKEFQHFAYANPKCVAWLQRDQGRADTFELVIRWEAEKTHEVFVVTNGQPSGNTERAKALLNSMLTTPSIVLSNQS